MKKTYEVAVPSRRRTHRSAEQWRSMLQAHTQSGLSQEAFCRREGVSTTSLSNWRKRLGIDSVSAMTAGVMPSPFIELANPVRPLDAGVKVRIELGAGIVLELTRA